MTHGILTDSLWQEHALLMRKFIFSPLLRMQSNHLGRGQNVTWYSRPGRTSVWVACDVCGRWCHFNCVVLKRKPKREYLFPICIAQYRWTISSTLTASGTVLTWTCSFSYIDSMAYTEFLWFLIWSTYSSITTVSHSRYVLLSLDHVNHVKRCTVR